MKNQELKVGKSVEIGNRVFYPILKIFHLKHHESEVYSILPLALVVVEGDMKYVLPMEECDDPDKLEKLMDMV